MGKLTRQDGRKTSTTNDVDAFLQKVAATPPPTLHTATDARLIFAMDATASREHTWLQAKDIQAHMFAKAGSEGGLNIQLAYYRGFNEFYASNWFRTSRELLDCMSKVHCIGGMTQIEKILKHAIRQTKLQPVKALVFIGDSMEENVDTLSQIAGELGILGVKCFIFQEGYDNTTHRAFKQIARLTNGAHCQFDAESADQLLKLLSVVAAYTTGRMQELKEISCNGGGQVRRLISQLVR